MNKATIRLILLLALSVAAFGQKFGYINSEYILSQSEEFLEAQNKLEVEGRKLEKQYYDMAGTLDSLQQDYERQKFLMTETNRATKENEMRRLAENIQRFQVEKLGPQGEFYQKQQALADPVLKKINAAIKKVGEDGGYDFIFDTMAGNILYAKESYDLTEKVIQELQK
ncbi:MAG: OmpH family outer membrane protein [Candidatus Marinimicrobia bacterium]|nr:OmpH family outer membrane protein [Candidatus Neomarinimicrobiota bacterium]MCF7851269.1 OmpH family outer membrane protein [Candidatus Neomarinimicrobiota bacterium]MCF7904881.1 OmpH family outer membrane protein [Candidatus Neomarinimicrobiota bacterium]